MKITLTTLIVVVILSVSYSLRQYMGFIDLSPQVVNDLHANEQSKFIKLGGLQQGINLHYRDEGLSPATHPDAPVLVLLHGIMASLHTWDGWVDTLKDDFRIIRIDIPGFGLTGPYADGIYNIKRSMDMVDQLTQALKIDTFSLAGNSMGGYISWSFAVNYPEKVERLVLLDAAGYAFKKPMLLGLLSTPILKDSLSFITPKFIVTQTLNEVYGDASKVTSATIDRYHELMLREGNRVAVVDVLLSISNIDSSPIKQLKVPTLVQWGEQDRWIPLAHAEKFVNDIEGAQLITYPGVGHVPMEEIPVQTAIDARLFLMSVIDEEVEVKPVAITPVIL